MSVIDNEVMPVNGDLFQPNDGYLSKVGGQFDQGVIQMQANLNTAFGYLTNDPSNPLYLAAYQQELSEYNLYRTGQTNAVKAYKDIDSAIVQNFH